MKIPAVQNKKAASIITVIYLLLLEFALYYRVIWYVQLFNVLLMFLLLSIFMVLIRRLKPSVTVVTVIMMALSIANEFSIKARSVAFQVSDFFCLVDAMRLSGRYRFTVTWGMVWAVISCGLLLAAWFILLRNYHDKAWKRSNLFSGATAFCIALPVTLFSGMENHNDGDMKFNINEFTEKNGVLYSLFVEAKKHGIEPPESYSAKEAAAMLEGDSLSVPEKRPNIIVIMNESLADYDLVGTLDTTEDVLPFLHSMEENCIKGKAMVSVFGGYTCNSEWEFLTGNSMAFLPVTVVPYNQFINSRTDSLASSLKEMGYETCAVHPYNGVEWKRDQDYPLMGFDTFLTGPDFGTVTPEALETLPDEMDESLYFGDLEYIRGFVSDSEDYRKLYDIMENKEPGTPQFIFNVTIQNHGSYMYEGEDFTETEFIKGADTPINQYLTVAHESDKAFEELITYFTEYEEDTIILMFGDHQPALDMPYQSLFADPDNHVAVRQTNYTVPYIMWANYDVDWEEQELISLNYLSALLKKNAELPLDRWDTFRLSVMECYPSLNSYGIADRSGDFMSLEEGLTSLDEMQTYRKLQYYRMFDQYPEKTK